MLNMRRIWDQAARLVRDVLSTSPALTMAREGKAMRAAAALTVRMMNERDRMIAAAFQAERPPETKEQEEFYWMGRPVSSLTRDELMGIIRYLLRANEDLMKTGYKLAALRRKADV